MSIALFKDQGVGGDRILIGDAAIRLTETNDLFVLVGDICRIQRWTDGRPVRIVFCSTAVEALVRQSIATNGTLPPEGSRITIAGQYGLGCALQGEILEWMQRRAAFNLGESEIPANMPRLGSRHDVYALPLGSIEFGTAVVSAALLLCERERLRPDVHSELRRWKAAAVVLQRRKSFQSVLVRETCGKTRR